jgi:hypothetical protein
MATPRIPAHLRKRQPALSRVRQPLVLRDYGEGLPMPELKTKYGVVEATVYKQASRAGVRRPTRLTSSKRALILSLRNKPGSSERKVALEAGCSQTTVRRVYRGQ